MKKLTKILPLALALMFSGTAFADETTPPVAANSAGSASSTMVLTVPQFISITKKNTSVEAATAEFDSNYTTLTTNATMNAAFHVVTNVPNKVIYLKGTCIGADGEQAALYGDSASALNLVFANEQVPPATGAITNITGKSAVKASNENAIAFTLTPGVTADSNSGAAVTSSVLDSGKVTYTIQNGTYDFVYTLGTTALENTFSTHDTWGTYKATLLLTDANP